MPEPAPAAAPLVDSSSVKHKVVKKRALVRASARLRALAGPQAMQYHTALLGASTTHQGRLAAGGSQSRSVGAVTRARKASGGAGTGAGCGAGERESFTMLSTFRSRVPWMHCESRRSVGQSCRSLARYCVSRSDHGMQNRSVCVNPAQQHIHIQQRRTVRSA